MKLKSLISCILAAMILTTGFSAGAVSAPWSNTEELTEDLEFSTGVYDDGDRQEEHYVTYYPGGSIHPYLWYGMTSLGDRTVFTEAASQVESVGMRVLAGTNGDYFVMSSGQPVGLVVSDGRLITSDDGNPALGFMEDGSAFFGIPQLQIELSIRGSKYRLGGINKPLRKGEFLLYTADYASNTPASKEMLNLILVPKDDSSLSIGHEIELQVESILNSSGSISIPEDRWILCLTADSDEWRKQTMESLSPGDSVTLSISSGDPRWADCTYATGSLYKLITNGLITEDLDKKDKTRAPRTAVGIRKDGSVLFYTVDGRQLPYSAGVTLLELAQRLLELGCVEAGVLDGGGSTVIYAQSAGNDDTTIRNIPSNGREREVSTFLMLVSEGESSGQGRTLSLRSSSYVLLCGGKLQFTAGICDEKGAPVSGGGIVWSASEGSITSDGLYTAPNHACRVEILASDLDLQGRTAIDIIRTPDMIRLLVQDSGAELTRLDLERGESIDLTADAMWGLMKIQAEDEQFEWTCTGNAGTVDRTGRFTASVNGGSGTITVSAGDASMTIGVFVKTAYSCVESGEQIVSGSADGLAWSQENSPDRVRFGDGSMKMDYDLSRGKVLLPVQWNQREKAQYLYLWIYGNGSGADIYAMSGTQAQPITTLDFQGWKLLQADIGFHGLDALSVRGKGAGTIWIDQVLVSNDSLPDLEPPEIELDAYGTQITAKIYDQVNGPLDRDALRLLLDGKEVSFGYDPVSGVLKAETKDDELMHRVTLIAKDDSGNIASESIMIEGATSKPFADMNGHWAEEYAGYLYGRGVIAGRETADGLLFDPNTPVTRAEFAVLLSRWLDLDDSGAEMQSFSDADQIPDWALKSINAVSSLGLIQGEKAGDTLWFKPMTPLTRAQAATILGRTLEGGRLYADLVFKDSNAIPDWAAPYVSLMCYMGVLNGFEDGTFRPDDILTRAQAAKLLTTMS